MSARDVIAGDRSMAEALRIADEWLKRQGWKYSPSDVGKKAREVLAATSASPTP